MLKRKILIELNAWKNKKNRLPLIFWGARQVGKSTTIKLFSQQSFVSYHEFNFQERPSLKLLFKGDLNPNEILKALEFTAKTKIESSHLIFFDEIQECPEALTSLKYFSEHHPEQPIIAAGSYLGLIKNEAAFPVGKVEFLSLHPLTFFEFIENIDLQLFEFLMNLAVDVEGASSHIPEFFHQRALRWLQIYLCIGGLPQVVQAFVEKKENEPEAARSAREIQKRLVESYQSDFSKHSGTINANHILRVFEATAIQLGQAIDSSVSKFKFSEVIPRKKGFEGIDGPLSWLEKSRLLIKTYIANRFEHPIKAFTKQNYFKTYLFDVGILNAMLNVPIESLFLGDLKIFKGYLAENFVAQELFAQTDKALVGWSEGTAEIEFVITRGSHLCPIEVKASSRSRRTKSLDTLILKYHPKYNFKLSSQNLGWDNKKSMLTLPLYLVSRIQ